MAVVLGSLGGTIIAQSHRKVKDFEEKIQFIFVVFSYQDMIEPLPKDTALDFTPVVF